MQMEYGRGHLFYSSVGVEWSKEFAYEFLPTYRKDAVWDTVGPHSVVKENLGDLR